MSYSARVLLEQSIKNSQKLLLDYLDSPNIDRDLSVAFGDTFNTDAGISLWQRTKLNINLRYEVQRLVMLLPYFLAWIILGMTY